MTSTIQEPLTIKLEYKDIDENYIFFGDKMKNTIMDNSLFYNIIYSNEIMTLNNILLRIPLQRVTFDKTHQHTKFQCTFSKTSPLNQHTIKCIENIEYRILSLFKHHYYNEKTELQCTYSNISFFKVNVYNSPLKVPFSMDEPVELLMKISGIWERQNQIGLIASFSIYF